MAERFSEANFAHTVTVAGGEVIAPGQLTPSGKADFLRIQDAVLHAQALNTDGEDVRILVYPGVYRESLAMHPYSGSTDAWIHLEAAVPGTVVVSGSEVWRDWRAHGGGLYSREWPYDWGLSDQLWYPNAELADIVRRREMVFFNGTALRQVLREDRVEDGTFFISPVDSRLYIQGGDDANLSRVEVSERERVFHCNRVSNIAVTGFVFQHANSIPDHGAVWFDGCRNVVFAGNRVHWNNWNGLRISRSEDFYTTRNRMTYNGGTGWNAWRVRRLISHQDEASFNNWRGYQGGFLGWAVAGAKHLHMRDSAYRDFKAVFNKAAGLWLDTDNVNIEVRGARLCNNLDNGLYLELSQGPILIADSIIADNGIRGIFSSTTANTTLENNVIYDNGYEQIRLFGLDELELETIDGDATTSRVEHWTLRGNTIASRGGQALLVSRDWDFFRETLSSSSNRWYRQYSDKINKLGAQTYSLAGWQAATSQDRDSRTLGMDELPHRLQECGS